MRRTILLLAALLLSGVSCESHASFHEDVICMTKNIYYEARGESLLGQLAVANVTMNRVGKKGFMDTVCGVVYQPSQFSWTLEPEQPIRNIKAWYTANRIAIEVLTGRTKYHATFATHYAHFTLDGKKIWMHGMKRLGQIGSHVFYIEFS